MIILNIGIFYPRLEQSESSLLGDFGFVKRGADEYGCLQTLQA
jgi:hypothetical protein